MDKINEHQLKKLFKSTFDTVAEGYDNAAMRFFPESAQHISTYLQLNGNEHILDVATGTGCAALTLAKDLPRGQVTGIDFSKGMLSQARNKQAARGIRNVTFAEMDMQSIAFPDNHFDIAVSAFSIFFVEDMKSQLNHVASKVKNGGKIIMTTFYDTSFSPLVTLFLDRLKKYGIEPPTLAWKRVATTEQCVRLFSEAGIQNMRSEQVECGYHLRNGQDWWQIVWNGGFRGLVNQLAPHEVERFKKEHLSEVDNLATDQGIWIDMAIIYTFGSKQA